MRNSLRLPLLVRLVLALAGCADQVSDPAPAIPADAPADTPGTTGAVTPAGDPAPASESPAADPTSNAMDPAPAGTPEAPVVTPAAACSKQLTIILTVGVPGLSKIKTNGCWKPVITDGAAVSSYRKCSTSTFKVTNNPSAPNWAYDDTNPTHNATTEQNFFTTCAKGATGDGYVFMANSSGWRVLTNPTVKAYFAELYTSTTTDIDSHFAVKGVYTGNTTLAKRDDIYPMMNFGPPASANLQAKVGTEATKLCATVKDGGYFGLYNASWQDGMAADDPRLEAVEKSLDACTGE